MNYTFNDVQIACYKHDRVAYRDADGCVYTCDYDGCDGHWFKNNDDAMEWENGYRDRVKEFDI